VTSKKRLDFSEAPDHKADTGIFETRLRDEGICKNVGGCWRGLRCPRACIIADYCIIARFEIISSKQGSNCK